MMSLIYLHHVRQALAGSADYLLPCRSKNKPSPDEPSPANLHSETEVKSVLPDHLEKWTLNFLHTGSSQTVCGHLHHQSRDVGAQALYIHMTGFPRIQSLRKVLHCIIQHSQRAAQPHCREMCS